MELSSEQLIEKYSTLARSIALKYARYGVPFDDLFQEGLLGILEAANKFDPQRGTKFSTYATYWIKKKIIESLKKERKNSLDSIHLIEEVVAEQKAAPVDKIPEKIKLPDNMPTLEKKVILSLFEHQKTLKEIAVELNLSRERVRQIKEKALRRLRAAGLYNQEDK